VKRQAAFLKKSKDGKRAIYVDAENWESILAWVNESDRHKKKFFHIIELLLAGHVNRDLYDKEDFEIGCEHVTAMKPFKGKSNPRIYCQQFNKSETNVFVIVASELLPKKKSEKLSNIEKAIIRRVATYQYQLRDE